MTVPLDGYGWTDARPCAPGKYEVLLDRNREDGLRIIDVEVYRHASGALWLRPCAAVLLARRFREPLPPGLPVSSTAIGCKWRQVG